MPLLQPEFLEGGPDVLKPGSSAFARISRRARAVPSGTFILMRFPGVDGTRLLVIKGAAGHERMTCLEPMIDAMFRPEKSARFRGQGGRSLLARALHPAGGDGPQQPVQQARRDRGASGQDVVEPA